MKMKPKLIFIQKFDKIKINLTNSQFYFNNKKTNVGNNVTNTLDNPMQTKKK